MTMGKGGVINVSCRQKLTARSSMMAKLAAANDAVVMMLWTKTFLEAQGHIVDKNMLFQHDKSAALLEENSKRGSNQRWS